MERDVRESIENAVKSMKSAVSRLSNAEARKERDYQRLARGIIDAVEAKIQETGKKEFKIPESSSLLRDSIAKCGISIAIYRWGERSRSLIIIEESPHAHYLARRGITIVDEIVQRVGATNKVFPFIQFTEEITYGSDTKKMIYADRDSPYDLRPRMMQFLEDIEKWEPES